MEEAARFLLNDAALSTDLKQLRHDFAAALADLPDLVVDPRHARRRGHGDHHGRRRLARLGRRRGRGGRSSPHRGPAGAGGVRQAAAHPARHRAAAVPRLRDRAPFKPCPPARRTPAVAVVPAAHRIALPQALGRSARSRRRSRRGLRPGPRKRHGGRPAARPRPRGRGPRRRPHDRHRQRPPRRRRGRGRPRRAPGPGRPALRRGPQAVRPATYRRGQHLPPQRSPKSRRRRRRLLRCGPNVSDHHQTQTRAGRTRLPEVLRRLDRRLISRRGPAPPRHRRDPRRQSPANCAPPASGALRSVPQSAPPTIRPTAARTLLAALPDIPNASD